MIIYRSLEEIAHNKKTVLSIGMFDGVHRAHQKIIAMVVDAAKAIDGRNMLVTFDPHPKEIVGNPGSKIEILSTFDEKIKLFEKYGIREVFVIPFTHEFSQLSLVQFYKKYIIDGVGIAKVIEGNNHHLGHDRKGNVQQVAELGKKMNFSVESVSIIAEENTNISSSEIRHMLHDGNVQFVNKMLGREYSFSGIVVRGHGRGKKLGYPTANIDLDDKKKLIPKIGVYAVKFFVRNAWYDGMMSIGHNPTFHESHERTTEVNIFDFDEDIYGENVTVKCIERTRDEKKFNAIEELIQEMGHDKITIQKILKHYKLLS